MKIDVTLLLIAALAARLLLLWLLPSGSYSNDLGNWAAVAEMLRDGKNPYAHRTYLNHPPFWMQLIYLLDVVARLTRIPFVTVVRLLLIVFDVFNVALALLLAQRFLRIDSPRRLLLWGLALNPILLLLVCQHGNFDALVVSALLLFLYFFLAFQAAGDLADWLLACLFLGVGVLAKTVPLLLFPLLAYRIERVPRKARLLSLFLVLAPVTLALSVVYVLAPRHVIDNVILYRGFEGWFGITGILRMAGAITLAELYSRIFLPIIFLFLLLIARRLRTVPALDARDVVLLAGTILAAAVTFGPGYGPQYIAWFLPLFVLTFPGYGVRWRRLLTVTWVIATVTYLIEYAQLPSHGGFLIGMVDLPRLSTTAGQTLLRLPLFLCYVGVIVLALRIFRREALSQQQ